jgi:hypothetical protein
MPKIEIVSDDGTAQGTRITVDGVSLKHVRRCLVDLNADTKGGGLAVVVVELYAIGGLQLDLPDAMLEALQRSLPVEDMQDHGSTERAAAPEIRTGSALDDVNVRQLAYDYLGLPLVTRHTLLRNLRLASWDEVLDAQKSLTAVQTLDTTALGRARERGCLRELVDAVRTARTAAGLPTVDRDRAPDVADVTRLECGHRWHTVKVEGGMAVHVDHQCATKGRHSVHHCRACDAEQLHCADVAALEAEART